MQTDRRTRDALRLLDRAAPKPERFSAGQREALVDLAIGLVEGPDDRTAIRAAAALVAMEGANLRAEGVVCPRPLSRRPPRRASAPPRTVSLADTVALVKRQPFQEALRLLHSAAPRPEKFTPRQRELLVELAAGLLYNPDALTRSSAVGAIVSMEGANQQAESAGGRGEWGIR
ncbi:MAG: hypothetical protein HYS13_05115 [Planctomycetia bacterium]|nr:hypothetical protein [Planctomycetia bacterium]